jgi:excisionase family DNA binding protein
MTNLTTPGTTAPTVQRLLTYKQAGELLGVTERTIWTLVDRGELPAVRFGRSVRIDPTDLRGFIDKSKGGNDDSH